MTLSSTNVPIYPRLNPFLGFFVGVGFVGSTNVPHDAHALGAKHHVIFFYPLESDSLVIVTCSTSQSWNDKEVMRDLTFEGGRLGTKCVFPSHSH